MVFVAAEESLAARTGGWSQAYQPEAEPEPPSAPEPPADAPEDAEADAERDKMGTDSQNSPPGGY